MDTVMTKGDDDDGPRPLQNQQTMMRIKSNDVVDTELTQMEKDEDMNDK